MCVLLGDIASLEIQEQPWTSATDNRKRDPCVSCVTTWSEWCAWKDVAELVTYHDEQPAEKWLVVVSHSGEIGENGGMKGSRRTLATVSKAKSVAITQPQSK